MAKEVDGLRAAGGVVWRRHRKRTEVLLVHRPRRSDWSLPKGKAEAGENPVQTAVREVHEETGAVVRVGVFLAQTAYRSGGVPKRVTYWSMLVPRERAEDDLCPADRTEVDDVRWMSVREARSRLTYPTDRDVLDRFVEYGETPVRLLLVRHASAGDRSDWSGPDDLRPLDAKGRRQSAALAATLGAFGPVQVLSARPLRCEQTVAGLAHRLGLRVGTVEGLSEQEWAKDPKPGLALLRDLLTSEDPIVVCSQGGVIPKAVKALEPQRLHRIPKTRKGSVWSLGVRKRRVLTADYYADLSRSVVGSVLRDSIAPIRW